MIDEESLVKMRTNTCLSETSGIPSYSVVLVTTDTLQYIVLTTDINFS
jgi:hypothetical protein